MGLWCRMSLPVKHLNIGMSQSIKIQKIILRPPITLCETLNHITPLLATWPRPQRNVNHYFKVRSTPGCTQTQKYGHKWIIPLLTVNPIVVVPATPYWQYLLNCMFYIQYILIIYFVFKIIFHSPIIKQFYYWNNDFWGECGSVSQKGGLCGLGFLKVLTT